MLDAAPPRGCRARARLRGAPLVRGEYQPVDVEVRVRLDQPEHGAAAADLDVVAVRTEAEQRPQTSGQCRLTDREHIPPPRAVLRPSCTLGNGCCPRVVLLAVAVGLPDEPRSLAALEQGVEEGLVLQRVHGSQKPS